MDKELICAMKEKNHAYILQSLQPLFLKYLKGVPTDLQQDFLQEYQLVCIQTVEAYLFES
ncbi:hypothetical protein [Jeotgalibaca arthritidis]|uniref:hypothetical protein n=1 Tax=Jeotgalibaca arthritidis TaxID=1868794 RepID=UPI0035A11D3E